MKRVPKARQKELEDDKRLLRAWRAWHREQLVTALAGAHGAMIAQVMTVLDRLELDSAAALLDAVRGIDWRAIDIDVRFEVLHQVNAAITRLRERNGMPPIDDPLPPQRNAFMRIKEMLFPVSPMSASAHEFGGHRRSDRSVIAVKLAKR